MLTGYLYIYFYNNTYTTAVCEVCACVRGTGGRKHSYGRLCCSPLTMEHNLFHDVGVETLSILTIVWGTQ